MNIESFIDTLSSEEQQTAFDMLWKKIATDGQDLPSPKWHGEVLAHREKNPSNEPKMSIPDAKAEVKRLVDERRNSQ